MPLGGAGGTHRATSLRPEFLVEIRDAVLAEGDHLCGRFVAAKILQHQAAFLRAFFMMQRQDFAQAEIGEFHITELAVQLRGFLLNPMDGDAAFILDGGPQIGELAGRCEDQ